MPEAAPTENSVLQLMEFLPHQPHRGPVMPGAPEFAPLPGDPGDDTSSLEVDFALALARLIDDAGKDPSQFRAIVYQLARERLQEQIPKGDAEQTRKVTRALDVAVQRVEAFAKARDNPQRPLSGPEAAHPIRVAAEQLAAFTLPKPKQVEASTGQSARHANASFASGRRNTVVVRFLAVFALIAGAIAALSFFQGRREPQPLQTRNAPQQPTMMGAWANAPAAERGSDAAPAKAAPDVRRAAIAGETAGGTTAPIPAGFGIYAISANRLFKLDALPFRAPDSRAALPTKLRPAAQKFPGGKIKFIVHRSGEDAAIETAEVRLVARIARETSFDRSGKPVTTFPEDSWMIRNVAYPFRTQPMKDSESMFELRSDDPGLALSPGRYALIVNDAVYDFAVDGNVSSGEHCLERLTLATGVLHSECGQALFVQ
jgi:hypothetical protein